MNHAIKRRPGDALKLALVSAITLFVFLVLPGVISAQEAVWELGTKQFLNTPRVSPPLSIRSMGRSSLRTFRFVGGVGGVNFEAIVAPNATVSGESVSLDYDATAPDGHRLVATIDGVAFRPYIPDWQLKPIANFADSEFTAAVSLFGDGPDLDRYYYIQYHEAFENTLLGMRLLQADIILIDLANHWELPRLNGAPVLGAGESPPDIVTSLDAAREIADTINQYEFQSWVLTDTETPATVSVANGRLDIATEPYYYFWTTDDSEIDENARKDAEYQHKFEEYNAYVPQINQAAADNNTQQYDILNAIMNRLSAEIDTLEKELESFEPTVHEVSGATDGLRHRSDALRRFNPAVYDAVVQTSRFAAFFRYVKGANQRAWLRFTDQLTAVYPAPAVSTPTMWER